MSSTGNKDNDWQLGTKESVLTKIKLRKQSGVGRGVEREEEEGSGR